VSPSSFEVLSTDGSFMLFCALTITKECSVFIDIHQEDLKIE
jgi:hypothetical protein